MTSSARCSFVVKTLRRRGGPVNQQVSDVVSLARGDLARLLEACQREPACPYQGDDLGLSDAAVDVGANARVAVRDGVSTSWVRRETFRRRAR